MLQVDPNYASRVKMFKQARLNSLVDEVIADNAETLADVAGKTVDDLIKQHTLVSPKQAAELKAHFNLELKGK